jgi:Transcription termination factor nusG
MLMASNLQPDENSASGMRLVEPPGPPQSLEERRRWLMLVVIPGREPYATDMLRLRNCGIYWPNYSQPTQWPTRANGFKMRPSRSYAIMPGYLFMPLDMADSIPHRIIETTTGILRYARNGNGEPAFLFPADIEIIRKIEDVLNTPLPKDLRHSFKTGDKVRFVDDLTGRWPPGRVVRIVKSGRIGVESFLLGQQVLIEALPHQIERISGGTPQAGRQSAQKGATNRSRASG